MESRRVVESKLVQLDLMDQVGGTRVWSRLREPEAVIFVRPEFLQPEKIRCFTFVRWDGKKRNAPNIKHIR